MLQALTSYLYVNQGALSYPSSNIYVIVTSSSTYLVDVSNVPSLLEDTFKEIKAKGWPEVKGVILTHFHEDHIANLKDLPSDISIFASKNTARYLTREAKIIKEDKILNFKDLEMKILPFPSLHAKGCLDVLVGDTLLLGDSLAPRENKDGSLFYNPEVAFEMFKKMDSLDFTRAYDGHSTRAHSKDECLTYLLTLKQKGWSTLSIF